MATRSTSVMLQECRMCGSIIPSSEGVGRHKKVCRLMEKFKNTEYEQMATLHFPCPIVSIKRMLITSELSNQDSVKTDSTFQLATPRRKSNLRMKANSDMDISENESDTDVKSDQVNITMKANTTADTHRSRRSNAKTELRTLRKSGTLSFACPLKGCGAILSRRSKLKYHFARYHLQTNPYKCAWPGCKSKLSSPWQLKNHIMKVHSENGLMRCQKCDTFYSKKIPHKCERTPDDIIASDPVFLRVCEKNPGFKDLIFAEETSIKVKKTKLKKKPRKSVQKNGNVREGSFNCAFKGCGSVYTRMDNLKYHFVKHLKNCPFKCPVPNCNVTMSYQVSLNTHMKSIHSMDIKTSDATTPKINITNLIESDPVFLAVCEENPGFKELIFGRIKKNKFACPLNGCSSKLNNVRYLRKHFVKHLANNPYACVLPDCNRQFEALWTLMEHLHWHMGKTGRLQCPKCKTSFSYKRKLKNHECDPKRALSYVNNRKTKPEEINELLKSHFAKLKVKGFYKPSSGESKMDAYGLIEIKHLDINIRAIVESDPVFQKVCKNHPEFRNTMLKKVTKERKSKSNETYKCLKCSKAYKTLETLKSHESLMHSSRPFICNKCKKSFRSALGLENHMKFHSSTGNTIYARKLENGRWGCTKCSFETVFEMSANRHWKIMHNVTVPTPRKQMKCNRNLRKSSQSISRSKTLKKVADMQEDTDNKETLDLSTIKMDKKPVVVESVELDDFIVKTEPIIDNMEAMK